MWEGVPIIKFISEYFHTPVIAEDDGNCAAIGESIITDKHMEEGAGLIEYNQSLFQYIVSTFNQYKEDDDRKYTIQKSNLYDMNGILGAIKLLRDSQ